MRLPLVLGLVLALAGCGGSSDRSGPVALPPVTGAPSASPTATPAPGAGLQETPADAEKFARLFFEAFNTAYAQLDPEQIASLSLPSCMACNGYMRDLQQVRDSGATYEGGQTTVLSAAAPPVDDASTDVFVQYTVTDLVLHERSGSRQVVLPSDNKGLANVTLRYTEGGWKVAEVSRA